MFRRSVTLATKGVRNLSLFGEKQKISSVRDHYPITNKWVFLRKPGQDDFLFAVATVSGLFTFGCVVRVILKIATNSK